MRFREFISEKVIKAGIEWLIGILNPAAAFIKVCEAIYNVVMFFVEKGKEIIEFVNSILDWSSRSSTAESAPWPT